MPTNLLHQRFYYKYYIVVFAWVILSPATTTTAAPAKCKELLREMPNCTLPTIVQCDKQPPQCTAASTDSFPRNCWKCKNKDRIQTRSSANMPLTRGQAKAQCHKIRQEVEPLECGIDSPIFKCGKAPAQCTGLEELTECIGGLVICEALEREIQEKTSSGKRRETFTWIVVSIMAMWMFF